MIEPGGICIPLLIISSTVPLAELYVLPVDEAAFDVFEAAQGIEVVPLVVVERLLVAQPLPHRVGVGVDLEVERVVVEIRFGRGHVAPPVSRPAGLRLH